MEVGLMWFDNDKQASLETRVGRAAMYYRKRFGKQPNLCFVNPETGQEGKIGGMQVRNDAAILPNHFWVGVE